MESSHRLAVVMFADIVGYTAMMQSNEEMALGVMSHFRESIQTRSEEHLGRIIQFYGDGCLLIFNSSLDAMKCALELQVSFNGDPRVPVRIGLHLGDIVFKDENVFGDGVNIASRIESMGVPGSVLFSKPIRDQIRNKGNFTLKDLGSFSFKNVDEPMEVYALVNSGLITPDPNHLQTKVGSGGIQERSRRHRRIIYIGIIVLALAGVLWAYQLFKSGSSGSETNAKPTELSALAAIPFSNISADRETEFLGFALVDQVINSLSYLKEIVVRPSSSIRKYQNTVISPQEIAEELDVKYILTGHYLTSRDSIRLNIELIDLEKNQVLWTETLKESYSNVFQLQDVVAREVISGLQIQFTGGERTRMTKDVPEDPLAYEYYLRSLAYPINVEGLKLGIEMMKKAIELDSSYAPSFSELGYRTHLLARYAMPEDQTEMINKAIDHYQRALSLNRELLPALGNLSIVYNEIGDKERALTLAKQMIEINPNNGLAHFALGYVYRYAGMIDEAIREMELALKLDPRDRQYRSVATTYIADGQYEKALQSLALDKQSSVAAGWNAVIHIKRQNFNNARIELNRTIDLDPEGVLSDWARSMLAYLDGDDEKAIGIINEIIPSMEDPGGVYHYASFYSLFGDNKSAIHWLWKSVENGYYPYTYFSIDPFLDPIRDAPEFNEILETARQKHEEFKAEYF